MKTNLMYTNINFVNTLMFSDVRNTIDEDDVSFELITTTTCDKIFIS